MKTILVPVDFSKHSEYALEVAASIARKHGANIVVVHMMGLPESYLTNDEKQEVFNAIHFMKITKKKFERFLNKDFLKGIEISQAVRNYKVFSEINEEAREQEADLIVMGSHGATGLKEVFVGSNTEKVIRTSQIPVIVIKKQLKDFEIKKAVYVTNFDEQSLEAYFKTKQFLKNFDIEPQLLFVNIPEKFMSTQEMMAQARPFLEETSIDPDNLKNKVVFYDDYTLQKGVFNYSKKEGIDLIIIPTHGREGVAHFFYGSISEDIANHADIPVLTFRL